VTSGPRLEELLRELAPQVLGVLARRTGQFDAAEDAVQEALLAAAQQWPEGGVPENPRGWLLTVASRRMINAIRGESARRRREETVAASAAPWGQVAPAVDATAPDRDDTLTLLFLCCHPALSPASQIAITLRAVGGLTTGQIARAFLVPEATMAQRISRAKQSIRAAGATFHMPPPAERPERLRSVLHVLYLVFNEGYIATSGPDLQRPDLTREAIRLTRDLHRLLPDEGEVAGLLALMLLTDARRAARTGPLGELIPLDEQDRTLWDQQAIVEGVALVSSALSSGSVSEYQLLAAIAALHDEAPRTEDTDWPQILALYCVLRRMSDNPVVELNHAIATAMVEGPHAGLALLESLAKDERLAGSHRLTAVRVHLLERAGERQAAIPLYREAAARTTSIPERNYLLMRAGRLSE
jgi:RNA polymerase sigma factor (sigma-70 family)